MQNNNKQPDHINPQLITLPTWILLALFVAPLIIAFVIYLNWNKLYFAEEKHANKVSTPVNLQSPAYFDINDKTSNIPPDAKR